MPTGSNLRDFFGALADPNQGAEPEAGQADQAVATEDPNQSSTSDQADPNQFADPNSGQVDAPTGVADPDQFADPNSGQVDPPTDVADPDQFADPNSGQVDQPTDVADPDQFSDPNSGQVDASADSGAANPLEFLTSAVADVLPDEFSASRPQWQRRRGGHRGWHHRQIRFGRRSAPRSRRALSRMDMRVARRDDEAEAG